MGDKRAFKGVPIPEFGNKPMPYGDGFTFEDLAEVAIASVNHEIGHAFWSLPHSGTGIKSKFRSMMGGGYASFQNPSEYGCMNPKKTIECVLLPVEAQRIASSAISRPNDFGWVQKDVSEPKVKVLSENLVGSILRVTFQAEDLESGINSLHIIVDGHNPWFYFWRQINHLENMENITAEVNIFGGDPSRVYLVVMNNQGRSWQVKLLSP